MKPTFFLALLIISVVIFNRFNLNHFSEFINKVNNFFVFLQCLVGESLSLLDFIKTTAQKWFGFLKKTEKEGAKREISSYKFDKATGVTMKFLNIMFQMKTKSVRETVKFEAMPTSYLNRLKNIVDRHLPEKNEFTIDLHFEWQNATAVFMVLQDFLSNLRPPLVSGKFFKVMKTAECKNNI